MHNLMHMHVYAHERDRERVDKPPPRAMKNNLQGITKPILSLMYEIWINRLGDRKDAGPRHQSSLITIYVFPDWKEYYLEVRNVKRLISCHLHLVHQPKGLPFSYRFVTSG